MNEKRGHVITWERANKGDMDVAFDHLGFICAAQQRDDSAVAYLCVMGALNEHHVWAGKTYLDWQTADRSPRGYRTTKLNSDTADHDNDGIDLKGACYRRLIRLLGKLGQRAIEEALDPTGMRHMAKRIVYDQRDAYRCRFDTLIRFIESVEESLKADIEKVVARHSETR